MRGNRTNLGGQREDSVDEELHAHARQDESH